MAFLKNPCMYLFLLFCRSNAIGPVISIWVIYDTGMIHSKAATPIWILLYGGAGIVIGLFFWGRRVIETIGESLTPVTPTRYVPTIIIIFIGYIESIAFSVKNIGALLFFYLFSLGGCAYRPFFSSTNTFPASPRSFFS